MTGRELFSKAKTLLYLFSAMVKILPPPIREYLFVLVRGMSGKIGIGIRYLLLRSLCETIGDNVSIRDGVHLIAIQNMRLGSNISVHPNCYIDASGGVTIGDNVSIATNTILISTTHTWEDKGTPIKYNPMQPTPIVIDDDVWIGCGVKIIGPCHIHKRTIVAAGAVVKGEVGPQCIVGGILAKEIKKI